MATTKILKLVLPDVKYKNSFVSGLSEMTTDSEKDDWVYLGDLSQLNFPRTNFSAYVSQLVRYQSEPHPNFVPQITRWAIDHDEEVVGRISLRLELNDFLKSLGGHIGYVVRPSRRNQGIASEMLRQILTTTEASFLGHLLITCDEDNSASERVILKNGGKFESFVERDAMPRKKRFWIQPLL